MLDLDLLYIKKMEISFYHPIIKAYMQKDGIICIESIVKLENNTQYNRTIYVG